MVKKVITFLDLQGRYRVASPAYGDPTNPVGETEDETIARVVARLKVRYSLPDDHAFHYVEDTAMRQRLTECEGTHFRYAGLPDANKCRDARGGAWEMDTDGRPKVNMVKARLVQMDCIRCVRNEELKKLDVPSIRAIESGDTVEQARVNKLKQDLRDIPQTFDVNSPGTLKELKEAWPEGLPAERSLP
jgi:hypothetical protein